MPTPPPPEDTKWKPGESGNPAGRPKGRKNFRTVLLELLDEQDHTEERGVTTKQVALMDTLIRMAKKENLGAMQSIMDRTDGKPEQTINDRRSAKEWLEDITQSESGNEKEKN